MEVILKRNVDNLGDKDELVTVKNGYGRNYLIPKGYAMLATASAKKMQAETMRQRAHKEERAKDEARKAAAALQEMNVSVKAKVGDSGKIFGSISSLQLAEAIEALGHKVDRKKIKIKDEPIKHVGTFEAEIKFHKEVVDTIKFEVVEG